MRKMESEGPYKCAAVAEGIDGIVYRIYGPGVETLGADFSQERGARIVAVVANSAYAEGRKAAENYTELMLKHATAEVRRCYEEIRRLEDKYARKFHRVPEPIEYGGRRI